MEVVLTNQNFEQEVLKFNGKVLVDFWAPWCGPCQIMGPLLEEFAKSAPANVKVGKINVDENNEIAGKYGIMSIPTIMVFENGNIVKQAIGVQSREALNELVS